MRLRFERLDRFTVEDAVALSAVGEGVVGAAGEVAGQHRRRRADFSHGRNGAARRGERAVHARLRPWETDAPIFKVAELVVDVPVDVIGRVARSQLVQRGKRARVERGEATRRELALKGLADEGVLWHGEPVVRRQRHRKVVVVEELQRTAHHGRGPRALYWRRTSHNFGIRTLLPFSSELKHLPVFMPVIVFPPPRWRSRLSSSCARTSS